MDSTRVHVMCHAAIDGSARKTSKHTNDIRNLSEHHDLNSSIPDLTDHGFHLVLGRRIDVLFGDSFSCSSSRSHCLGGRSRAVNPNHGDGILVVTSNSDDVNVHIPGHV